MMPFVHWTARGFAPFGPHAISDRPQRPSPAILKADHVMGLFKADFYRFFAFGFAGGALLVLGVMGIGSHSSFADDFAPAAQAAETR
nr:hypothetical protein TQ38_22220 [Novosphingobium sp. P6W]